MENFEKKEIPKLMFNVQTTLFLIDDEPAILSSLFRMLRREGYNILQFESGKDAIAQLENYNVDIIITDMRMPEISGLDLLMVAKEICPEAIRVILSGFEEREIVLNALSNGLAHQYFLKPWDDLILKSYISKTIKLQNELRSEKLSDVLLKFNNLPSSKKFQSRLLAFLTQKESSLNELVEEIKLNPVLTAKLLQVANSVYYASYKQISNIRDAIIFIGTAYVHILASAIDMSQNLQKDLPVEVQKHIEVFWDKALKRAVFARKISEQWKKPVDSQSVYIASLLQDIGLLIRICSDIEKYEKMLAIKESEKLTLSEADKKIFPISHEQISGEFLRLWNYPEEIIDAVISHHNNKDGNKFSQIMHIAEMLESNDSADNQDIINEWQKKIMG